jgi:hypothetical protein
MVAIASALYAAPIWMPLEWRFTLIYVFIVTYQDPQIKYSKNIIRQSRMEAVNFMKMILEN